MDLVLKNIKDLIESTELYEINDIQKLIDNVSLESKSDLKSDKNINFLICYIYTLLQSIITKKRHNP